MNKKIFAAAALILVLVTVFAACKKKDTKDEYEYTKIGDYDVTIDKDGSLFVTNPDGDKIPVTSSEDGFFDDINDLVTETKPKPTNADNKNNGDNSGNKGETTTDPTKPDVSNVETTTDVSNLPTNPPIEIGKGGAPDTIDREEIRNS